MIKVLILGVTGSIGQTALRGISQTEDIEIVGATYHKRSFEAPYPILKLEDNWDELTSFIEERKPDVVLNGIANSAGLMASICAVNAGCTLALANKETIVLGGRLFLDYAKSKGVKIIPVDSEHSAIDELLLAHKIENTDSLIITASGGPFLNTPQEKLKLVTPEVAVKHPTWNMGPKISIDSSTLANKGLEVIEANKLFGFDADHIEVVIHPQSVVHSMIRTKSGQIYAQMSPPDMVFPIMRSLLGNTVETPFGKPLDFTSLDLNFRKLDFQRFPFVADAFECIKDDSWSSMVFNIADEVAVEAFMQRKITFTEIHPVVHKALSIDWGAYVNSVYDIPSAAKMVKTKVSQQCL